MTWQQFLIHAQAAGTSGFTTHFGSEKMSRREKDLIDPETTGTRWLAENDKGKRRWRPRKQPDVGYYGPTIARWVLGYSDGFVVQVMVQYKLKRKNKSAGKPRGGEFRKTPLRVDPSAHTLNRKIPDSHIAKMNEARKNRAARKHGNDVCRCSRCRNVTPPEAVQMKRSVEFVG